MIKINSIISWAQGIIVSVIIATIIEVILPEGNNSKYVKTIIGVFVLFTIISPIINKISGKNKNLNLYSNEINNTTETITTNANVDNKQLIKQMYEENLKIDIKAKISQKGYTVGDLNLEIMDNDEYTLNSINMKITGTMQNRNNSNNNQKTTTIVENVENVIITVSGNSSNKNEREKSVISESEKRKLVQYLSGVYEVKESNIHVY